MPGGAAEGGGKERLQVEPLSTQIPESTTDGEESVLGIQMKSFCFGIAYQVSGAVECLIYTFGKFLTGARDYHREKTVAYYLDLWTFFFLGLVSVVMMIVMILLRWKFSDLDEGEFNFRYEHLHK